MTKKELRTAELEPRFIAGVKLIGRTGAQGFLIGWSEEEPIVWFARSVYGGGRAEAAGAMHPVQAVLRLCEQLIDGGMCAHCRKWTIFAPDIDSEHEQRMAAGMDACLYAWDPELATFRRGCE